MEFQKEYYISLTHSHKFHMHYMHCIDGTQMEMFGKMFHAALSV